MKTWESNAWAKTEGCSGWRDLGLVSFVVCLALLVAYLPFLLASSLPRVKLAQFGKCHAFSTCRILQGTQPRPQSWES